MLTSDPIETHLADIDEMDAHECPFERDREDEARAEAEELRREEFRCDLLRLENNFANHLYYWDRTGRWTEAA